MLTTGIGGQNRDGTISSMRRAEEIGMLDTLAGSTNLKSGDNFPMIHVVAKINARF